MCQTASQQRGRGKPNEAFSDFEGCGALQCNTCKTFFCCFCFTIGSSGNVHKHVTHFKAYHNKRRHEEAMDYIKKLEIVDTVKDKLIKKLEKHNLINEK